MNMRKAVTYSLMAVTAALAFGGVLAVTKGQEAALLFLAGYGLELSLSLDNLMVFMAIFAYFKIKPEFQNRVLHYGILGAVLFRLIFVMIGAGALLLAGPWVGILFGAFVIWSAVAMLTMGDDDGEEVDYNATWYVKLARKFFLVSGEISGGKFFTKVWSWERSVQSATTFATPLFLCLVAIEISDIMFSFDSVPAVIALVQDPMIIYASIMFAVLCLRSFYFVLEALNRYLTHLSKAVIAILFFVGAKLALHSFAAITGFSAIDILDVGPGTNLAIVLGLLGAGVIASLVFRPKSLCI